MSVQANNILATFKHKRTARASFAAAELPRPSQAVVRDTRRATNGAERDRRTWAKSSVMKVPIRLTVGARTPGNGADAGFGDPNTCSHW